MGNTNSITMTDLMNEVRATQQQQKTQADINLKRFMQRIDEHEDNMSKGLYRLNDSVNQAAAATIKQTRDSEKRFMQRIDEHEDNMSKGFYRLNDSVNQAAAASINQTRESEKRLSDKIDSIGGRALSTLDWITVIIVTIIGGIGGWLFSKCMIAHQFAAWVDREDTINYVRDAAGNITDITSSTVATTVWPTVILTIVLFAVVGLTVSYAICSSIRTKEEVD